MRPSILQSPFSFTASVNIGPSVDSMVVGSCRRRLSMILAASSEHIQLRQAFKVDHKDILQPRHIEARLVASKVMSMYPDSIDTSSKHVDSADRLLQRVEETRIYQPIRQVGEQSA